MSTTSYALNDAMAVKLWSKKLAIEAEKSLEIASLMGTGENSIIQIKDETSKNSGDRVRFSLFTQLRGAGKTEGQAVEGNEEALSNWTDELFINELKHAVRFKSDDTIDLQRVPFEVRSTAYDSLAHWFSDRFSMVFFRHVCGYTASTWTFEGQSLAINNAAGANVWTGNNPVLAPSANRVLRAAAAANDEALVPANVFDLTLIDKAVERAKLANPRLRAANMDGQKRFVIYLHPSQITSLRTTTATGQWLDITKAIYMGSKKDNPIYDGALGEYNNVIIKEHEHVTPGVNSATGAEIPTVRRAVLLGAQAVTFAKGQKTKENTGYKITEKTFDYDDQVGVQGRTIYGMKKTRFDNNSEDFGTMVISTYAAAA